MYTGARSIYHPRHNETKVTMNIGTPDTPNSPGNASSGDGSHEDSSAGEPRVPGGLIHSYQRYDPQEFPSPISPSSGASDAANAAMEHMLAYGSMREFTEEELANAIRLDPSMFGKLGPSIESLAAMLRERKRKILETYDVNPAKGEAASEYTSRVRSLRPPAKERDDYIKFTNEEQLADLESLWYRQRDDRGEFATGLMRVMQALANKYQLDELADKYNFTGRDDLSVEDALAVKEELETIDKLLDQLKQAAENAQLGIIDMEELAQFAEPDAIEDLNRLHEEIQDYLREAAKNAGLEKSREGFSLSPRALRLFQNKILTQVFSDLAASRSGRHTGPIVGEGAVELQRTKEYEFGDSATNIDLSASIINAAARGPSQPGGMRVQQRDLSIHLTKNNPRCATMVLMDMSGSMRYGGQYINCKKMALALDGLIRREYPGDYLGFVEMFTFAKLRRVGEVPAMMPKPVTIHQPTVRLKADMSNPNITEIQVPQHFTNIQHALNLSRRALANQDTPNRQVMLITDGLPTAHFDGKDLYMLYPPDRRTEEATMREAMLCKRENITINIFLLPSWSQSSEDVQFAHTLAETTGGRVFFTGGKDLDRFVLWDYVNNRRSIIS
jgi:uncharacterized protein with von Willebrand factor type A (vWA) domain